jgi:aldose sugar dehydrogenase
MYFLNNQNYLCYNFLQKFANNNNMKQKLSFIILLFCLSLTASSVADNDGYKISKMAQELGVIWAMDFITDDKIIFTQRAGKVGILNTTTREVFYLKGLPKNIIAKGQGGLLDVAISPSYPTDKWLYFSYCKINKEAAIVVLARAKIKKGSLSNWQELLQTQSYSDNFVHFGGRITFDNKYLYLSIGDRGLRENAQNLQNHAGSILRLTYDGKIPPDNPFVNKKNALPEIYSYGHRNPQGLVWDEKNKRLWAIEHGPRGGDEINLIKKGANYGWPTISYGKEYWGPVAVGEGTHKEGMEQPVYVYTPSIAPASLLYYTGDIFPKYKGNLFAGALKLQHINRLQLNEQGKIISEKRLFTSLGERIREVVQSPQGFVYFSTDSGDIYKILPK